MLLALLVVASAVAVGGVAQTDSQRDASSADAEPNDTPANATTVRSGEMVNATLSSPEDVDYYAVNVTAGEGILPRLHLEGPFEGSAVVVDLVGPNGAVVTESTNDALGGPKNVAGAARPLAATDTAYTADTATTRGTYYVRVQESRHATTNDSATYDYSLSVTTEDLDRYDPNENGTTATPLEVGTPVEATTTGYDNDVYAVNLTAGRTYTVDVDSEHQQLSTQLNVFDDASLASDENDYENPGSVAGPVEFSGDGALTFTPDETGTYYVEFTESTTNNDLL